MRYTPAPKAVYTLYTVYSKGYGKYNQPFLSLKQGGKSIPIHSNSVKYMRIIVQQLPLEYGLLNYTTGVLSIASNRMSLLVGRFRTDP